jgi:putative FmdB family regulatory protein
MPTYSYRCTECGTAFDIQQAFTDDSLTECPTCGGRLRKLFNSVGVTFNGSGFYRTDSRPAEKAGASESAPAASSPAPASTPAAAPTSKD